MELTRQAVAFFQNSLAFQLAVKLAVAYDQSNHTGGYLQEGLLRRGKGMFTGQHQDACGQTFSHQEDGHHVFFVLGVGSHNRIFFEKCSLGRGNEMRMALAFGPGGDRGQGGAFIVRRCQEYFPSLGTMNGGHVAQNLAHRNSQVFLLTRSLLHPM